MNLFITYVLPHPDEELVDASFFQGYGQGILGTAKLIEQIVLLPAHILEQYVPRPTVIEHRRVGLNRYRIIPLALSAIRHLQVNFENPFFCFLTINDKTADAVDELIERHDLGIPILHASSQKINSKIRIPLRALTRNRVHQHTCAVLQCAADAGLEEAKKIIARGLKRVAWSEKHFSIPKRTHNIVRPNELAAASIGRHLAPLGKMKYTPAWYIEEIVRTT
ncbi:MAG: hypothetical protein ABSC26_12470, partial [Stellaceae bacterium]